MYHDLKLKTHTLKFRIIVYIRLFILTKYSTLYGLIQDCTIINFHFFFLCTYLYKLFIKSNKKYLKKIDQKTNILSPKQNENKRANGKLTTNLLVSGLIAIETGNKSAVLQKKAGNSGSSAAFFPCFRQHVLIPTLQMFLSATKCKFTRTG